MCKKYVKMTHLMKLWARDRVELQYHRWEGQMSTCQSQHFKLRYEEVRRVCSLPTSKPNVMLYGVMAMIWAEIVLHKDVDWKTVPGKNVSSLTRDGAVIDSGWRGPSDCMPEWSNRGQGHIPAVVLKDAEDEWSDDDDEDETNDAPPPAFTGERHERREDREAIEFEHQMEEARRRSLQDRGREYGHGRSHARDHDAHGSQYGGGGSHYGGYGQGSSQHYHGSTAVGSQYGNAPQYGSHSGGGSHGTSDYGGSSHGGSYYNQGYSGGGSYYNNAPQYGSQGGSGSHGTTHNSGSSQAGSQYYDGSTGGGTYGYDGGSQYGGSSAGGSQYSAPAPPPTFGGQYYGNYGHGGGPSGHGDVYGGGPFIGNQYRGQAQEDNNDSSSEESE